MIKVSSIVSDNMYLITTAIIIIIEIIFTNNIGPGIQLMDLILVTT